MAVLIILLYPLAAGAILLTSDGWAINRLNVRIWITVTKPLGLTGVITPEMFADAMNVLLFIPFFAALAVLVPTWWWILLGAAMSSAVETYQAVIGTRDATVVDVLTNTLGTAVGVAIGRLLARGAAGRLDGGSSVTAERDAPRE